MHSPTPGQDGSSFAGTLTPGPLLQRSSCKRSSIYIYATRMESPLHPFLFTCKLIKPPSSYYPIYMAQFIFLFTLYTSSISSLYHIGPPPFILQIDYPLQGRRNRICYLLILMLSTSSYINTTTTKR